MEEQLRQAQEMKILGLLTSGVAHEVRNPLNGILAITEALANDLGDNPDYQPYVAHIKTQVTRLSDLMRDLLDLGRPIDKDNLLPTSIMWLISAALNSWHHSSNHSNRNIRVKADADANNWIVAAERARMQQVYINLFENACDHSPPESDVIIEVHKPNNYTIQVKIIDEGIGIKPEYFERLFEPFFTTRKEGTGLGLGIVKRIVESHGGSIIMYNNGSQRGCCVEIQLPLYDN